MVTITAAALIASAAVGVPSSVVRRIILLLTLAQAANLLVWPNTVSWWPLASTVMFVTALSALAWLFAYAVRLPPHFHHRGEGADL